MVQLSHETLPERQLRFRGSSGLEVETLRSQPQPQKNSNFEADTEDPHILRS